MGTRRGCARDSVNTGTRAMTGAVDEMEIDAGDGLRLHVVRSGTGPPLVLLHGFTGSTETWTPLRAALDDRFTMIAVDLPGHGRSSAPAEPARFALSRFADDLRRVLDITGVDRTAVLGYSVGGRAALRFALRHPARVAALVLESASPGIDDPAERAARVASDHELADSIEANGVPAFVNKWERLPLWASQPAAPDEARARLRAQRLANHADGLANSLRGAGTGSEPSVTDQLAGLDVPALLLAGAFDAKFVAIAHEMGALLPAARTVIIDGAGHAVHLERPTEHREAIEQFLNTVASDTGQWR
jgi:2-succinyl-6-hydroxy-2,4-cyclohexadiene-1-carboxylate synthase